MQFHSNTAKILDAPTSTSLNSKTTKQVSKQLKLWSISINFRVNFGIFSYELRQLTFRNGLRRLTNGTFVISGQSVSAEYTSCKNILRHETTYITNFTIFQWIFLTRLRFSLRIQVATHILFKGIELNSRFNSFLDVLLIVFCMDCGLYTAGGAGGWYKWFNRFLNYVYQFSR